jgi:hypothetical protein
VSSKPLTVLILASSVLASLVGSAAAAADLVGDKAGGEASVVGSLDESAAPTTTVASPWRRPIGSTGST